MEIEAFRCDSGRVIDDYNDTDTDIDEYGTNEVSTFDESNNTDEDSTFLDEPKSERMNESNMNLTRDTLIETESSNSHETNPVKILNWNIEGLMNKLGEADFIHYLIGFDIVCLTETFLEFDKPLDCFPNFRPFFSPAVKLNGRNSGGVLLMVKKAFERFVEVVDLSLDNLIVLRLNKCIFGTDKDVILCGVYICPSDSSYYKQDHIDVTSSICTLEHCLLDCIQRYDDECMYFLCGDFNARTGNLNMLFRMILMMTFKILSSRICVIHESQSIRLLVHLEDFYLKCALLVVLQS